MGTSGFLEPTRTPPQELSDLLSAREPEAQDRAWTTFVEVYSRLIVHTARSLGGGHDAVMDRYAYVLEHLRQDDCRRLRAFAADGRGKFTTWLTVVVRRMALDHQRGRYGRFRETEAVDPTIPERATRRRLVDLVGEQLDVHRLADPTGGNPERDVRRADLAQKLTASVNELTSNDRLLLTLRFRDELAAREIAAVMGFPTPFHVYRRIKAVLAALRTALERRGVRDPNP